MTQTGTAATALGIYMAKGSTVHLITEGSTHTLCGRPSMINPLYVNSTQQVVDAAKPESQRRLTEASKVTCKRCQA